MNNRRRMKRKALRLYTSINMTKNRRVYSETLFRTLLKEYKKKHEELALSFRIPRGESDHPIESVYEQDKTLVGILDKDHIIVKRKIKDRELPYIPSIYSFQKQYPPDSLEKYERLGSSIEEVKI